MGNLLSYKNYNGTVEYSKEGKCLYGEAIGIRSAISYKGFSIGELEADFRNAVDRYLDDCEAGGIRPEQPYKGSFNIRLTPDLHRRAAIYAIENGKTLNAVVMEAVEHMVGEKPPKGKVRK